MSEVYIGQILLTGFAFAPKGFALCNGGILSIAQNQALFSLLGTTYGGNGTTTFALPDLRGRTPTAFGNSADPAWQPSPYSLGEVGGVENVTLISTQLPQHNHTISGTSTAGSQRNPTGTLYGTNSANIYAAASGLMVPTNPSTLGPSGNTQPHPNMQPYRTISSCIALVGIFPSRN
ncbi:microcystin-dependent protein [Luteimonas gilva]|uniref:Microcystin-dependent protein n=1 Tax=Luteimonas gilva TaxID=2572684 RepID=A0A4U5JXK8_9GAMM|nr:tail fiber protein [Luteimonas gilva]TKR33488.1 microcystin-dependent protein [Luteimonas gilva]